MARPASNSGEHIDGVDYTTYPGPSDVMHAFDQLPKVVRRCVAELPYNFDTLYILNTIRRDAVSSHRMVRMLQAEAAKIRAAAEEEFGS